MFAHGLIPAHAGKTRPPTRPSPPKRVHPRSRGENIATAERPRYDVGSSPLTRGKRWEQNSWTDPVGLIPAHAGNTGPTTRTQRRSRAHPRSRGENSASSARGRLTLGSSPLTRGKHIFEDGEGFPGGLIPAHAGKTRGASFCRARARAHPRSRGENAVLPEASVRFSGSSPLTRGKRQDSRTATRRRGLIPAHAGKTVREATPNAPARAHPRSRGENRA